MTMLKVILTAAALLGAYVLGGFSILRFMREEYPATWLVWREEHKVKKELKKETEDDA